jgi:flagellar biosynthesis protein FliQ
MGGSVFAMFHLDYLSCFLTILATILLARKSWIGLLVAIVNSLIVCAIGLQTSQLGFIPANLFCICVYAFSMRPWLKEQTHTNRDQPPRQDSGSEEFRSRQYPPVDKGVGLDESLLSSDGSWSLKGAAEIQS